MSEEAVDKYTRWYFERFGSHPRARALLEEWLALPQNPVYRAHLEKVRQFRDGYDPIPDRDAHAQLLRSVGHDHAAVEALKNSNLLSWVFSRDSVYRGEYFGLHGAVAARLVKPPDPLREVEIRVLYDTLDRLMRGGEQWPEVREVPAVTRAFYGRLAATKFPTKHQISIDLTRILEVHGKETIGKDYRLLCLSGGAAQTLLGVAAAVKNGHTTATVDDAIEGCYAFLKLFSTDLRSLPPVVRHGKTGYER